MNNLIYYFSICVFFCLSCNSYKKTTIDTLYVSNESLSKFYEFYDNYKRGSKCILKATHWTREGTSAVRKIKVKKNGKIIYVLNALGDKYWGTPRYYRFKGKSLNFHEIVCNDTLKRNLTKIDTCKEVFVTVFGPNKKGKSPIYIKKSIWLQTFERKNLPSF